MRFIGIGSHASESYYRSYIYMYIYIYIYIYTADTSGVNRLASEICHNRLFRKKLAQNLQHMISTEVSSLATHNTRTVTLRFSEYDHDRVLIRSTAFHWVVEAGFAQHCDLDFEDPHRDIRGLAISVVSRPVRCCPKLWGLPSSCEHLSSSCTQPGGQYLRPY
jgi:hypothetical protein